MKTQVSKKKVVNKTKARTSSARNRNSKLKQNLKKFRTHMQKTLGRIDWKDLGLATLALILVLAAKGFFGPKAAVIAHAVIKSMNIA